MLGLGRLGQQRQDLGSRGWEWAEHLWRQARQAECKVYWKGNLTVRCWEYPMPGQTDSP